MKLTDAIKKRVNFYLKSYNINKSTLCERSGINPSTLSTFMNATDSLPQLDTILHICEGLEITLSEFFSDKMFDDAVYEKD